MLSVYLLYWYRGTETDAATAGFWRALVALADVHDMGIERPRNCTAAVVALKKMVETHGGVANELRAAVQAYTYMCIYIYIYVCMYIYMYRYMYVCIHMYICMYIYIICICLYQSLKPCGCSGLQGWQFSGGAAAYC